MRTQPRIHLVGACPVLLILAAGLDCQGPGDMPEGGTGGTVSFQRGIQPIFDAKCIVCHQPGGIAFLRGITLELTEQVSYDQLVSQRSVQDPDRIFVVPGDASSSLLFLKVSTDAPPIGDRMPLDANPLSETEIALIRDWIDRGALNN